MPYDALAELKRLQLRPVLQRGMIGWWVKFACRLLERHGYRCPVRDLYDEEIQKLVTNWQQRHGLEQTGIINEATWASFANEPAPAASPAGKSKQDKLRARIVSTLRFTLDLGIHEQGGENEGPMIKLILELQHGHEGLPWCLAFAWSVVDFACRLEGHYPIDRPSAACLSCSNLYRWAREHSLLREPEQAEPGDLYILSGGNSGWKHVGGIIAIETAGTLRLICVEGNTNEQGSDEGEGVYRKPRAPGRYPGIAVAVAEALK